MQFKFFVGIDVSKDTLDFSIVSNGNEIDYFQIENGVKSVQSAITKLKRIPNFNMTKALFCLEHTGLYINHCVLELHKQKASIWIEKAIQIIRSSGLQRGKTDKVDAKRIAIFAYRNCDRAKLWAPAREAVVTLKNLLSLRDRLISIKGQLKTPLTESKQFEPREVYKVLEESCKAPLKAVEKSLKEIDKKIVEIVKADESLKYLFDLLTSIPGIGKMIACALIITTNEFTLINCSKKYACYAGVVPFEHSSGSSVRGKNRVSHFANKNIKRLLHMAALSVTRIKCDLQIYWQRKIKEGKHKMVVLNAMRNKLIQYAFAVVNRGTKYEKNYQNRLVSS